MQADTLGVSVEDPLGRHIGGSLADWSAIADHREIRMRHQPPVPCRT